MEYEPGDEQCLLGINEMNANIQRDKKIVLVVVPVLLAIIAAVALYA